MDSTSLTAAPRENRGLEMMMSAQHTYAEIAADWFLWIEYVDPDGTMSRDEFDALTIEQKVALQVEAFGAEE